MNDEKFRELLADYIAGELDDQQVAAFRAELEASEERRKLAHELQAAAAALETNVLSHEEAERRTAALEVEDARATSAGGADQRAARSAPPRHDRLRAVLRYAAVIVLAFGSGFLARGWRSSDREVIPSPPPLPGSIDERYAADFIRVTQLFPESSTFSRSLLMLARK
ncbi:MAG: hypothetical protein ACE5I3_08260 [Phycisphaerae bacterium]